MSGVQQRLNLKRTPIDTWSLREQLTLASSVLKSGDQNWVTVSRYTIHCSAFQSCILFWEMKC